MPRRVRDKIALLFAINEVVLILILCSIRSARYYGNTALYQDVFTSYLCLTKFAQRGEPPQAVAKPPVSAKQARTLTRSHFALPLTSYLLPLTSYQLTQVVVIQPSTAIMLDFNLLEILRLCGWWLASILSVFGLLLSLWIVVPAPTFSLLPLGVCAPELSPWLIAIEAVALMLAVLTNKSDWFSLAIVCSFLGLCLSLLPLIQFPATERLFKAEIERVLGTDYLEHIPQAIKDKMRSKPLVIADVFRGISYPNIRINRGLVFASPNGVDLKLNTYQPLTTGKHPTLIIIYGGAWRTGSPSSYEQFSSYMAAQGYTAIAIDYRHAPQYKFPKQLEDVETAIEYIQTHADDLEVDLDRIAIMGRSAGGHLGTLAAYKQKTIRFKAIVNYYAPVDLADGYDDLPSPDPIGVRTILENFIGGSPTEEPELYHQASLTTYLKADSPPSLLIYPSRDHLVQAKFGRGLYEKLKATDNPGILLEIPWAEHAFDAVFFGVSNQLALYYTERFLAFQMRGCKDEACF